MKGIASYLWASKFLKENPTIFIQKAQYLNPSQAQKLNKFIVQDHFQKLKSLFQEQNMFVKPELLHKMDQKECRLNLHKEPKVLY
jgi:hypothetical protein